MNNMKIAVIHGQSHKGSTYNITKMLYDKIGGEVTEFFLPRDFSDICVGCTSCILKGEQFCPHYKKLEPILKAMDEADLLIFSSPVYVYHVTGAMKVFLDHFGYRWMVHRPNQKMFHKQAVCISTAAGAGMKSTNKDMADSLFFWGVPKIYKLGFAVRAMDFNKINEKTLEKIENKTTVLAEKIIKNQGKVKPNLKTKGFFNLMRNLMKKGWNEIDSNYWKQYNWDKKSRPWKE